MSNSDDKTQVETPPNVTESAIPSTSPTVAEADLENKQQPQQTLALPPSMGTTGTGSGGASSILKRWKREDLMKKWSMVLGVLGFLFSFLAFIIMATNKYGDRDDWRHFDKYVEYRYVLAVAILSTLYTGLQAIRNIHEISTGKQFLHMEKRTSALTDFVLDQIMAYLLISASSSAIPLTHRMREGADDILADASYSIFTDASAAAISMEFFAFLILASSALISGYKLTTAQSYI